MTDAFKVAVTIIACSDKILNAEDSIALGIREVSTTKSLWWSLYKAALLGLVSSYQLAA